jgi:hypothetical protein
MHPWLLMLAAIRPSVIVIGILAAGMGALIPVAYYLFMAMIMGIIPQERPLPWTHERLAWIREAVERVQRDIGTLGGSTTGDADGSREALNPDAQQRAMQVVQELQFALTQARMRHQGRMISTGKLVRGLVWLVGFLVLYAAGFFAVGALVALVVAG